MPDDTDNTSQEAHPTTIVDPVAAKSRLGFPGFPPELQTRSQLGFSGIETPLSQVATHAGTSETLPASEPAAPPAYGNSATTPQPDPTPSTEEG